MFGAIIGKVLSPFMPYILGGSIAVIAILSGLLWLSNSKYDTLLSDSAAKIERAQANADQFEQISEDQRATINNMIVQLAEDRIRQQFRDDQLALAHRALDEERRKNDSYRNRWLKVANKKPELLANIINRATSRRVHRIAVATCRADCDQGNSKNNSNHTTTEAATDSEN